VLIGSLNSLSSRPSPPSLRWTRDTTKQTHRMQEAGVESCISPFTHAAHTRRAKKDSTTTPTTSLWDSPWPPSDPYPGTSPGLKAPATLLREFFLFFFNRELLKARVSLPLYTTPRAFLYNRAFFFFSFRSCSHPCLFQWSNRNRPIGSLHHSSL